MFNGQEVHKSTASSFFSITSSASILSCNAFRVFEGFTFCALGQRFFALNVHSSHLGPVGTQIVCPNPTRRWLMS